MTAILPRNTVREIFGFILVGTLALTTDFVTFNLAVLAGVPPVLASLLSLILAATVAFSGNKTLTFAGRVVESQRRAFATFFIINSVGAGVVPLVVWLGDSAGLSLVELNVCRLGAIGLVSIGRFLAYRRWVFLSTNLGTEAGSTAALPAAATEQSRT